MKLKPIFLLAFSLLVFPLVSCDKNDATDGEFDFQLSGYENVSISGRSVFGTVDGSNSSIDYLFIEMKSEIGDYSFTFSTGKEVLEAGTYKACSKLVQENCIGVLYSNVWENAYISLEGEVIIFTSNERKIVGEVNYSGFASDLITRNIIEEVKLTGSFTALPGEITTLLNIEE